MHQDERKLNFKPIGLAIKSSQSERLDRGCINLRVIGKTIHEGEDYQWTKKQKNW